MRFTHEQNRDEYKGGGFKVSQPELKAEPAPQPKPSEEPVAPGESSDQPQ